MIKFKGIDLQSLGIIVEKTPKISKAKKRINIYEVEGRNGFLSVDTNSYEPFSVVIQCHCLDSADKDKIKEFLDGYGTLELEDGREYTAIINDAIPFEKVMRFKRFQVSFLVNPIAEDKEEITKEIDIEEKDIEGSEIKLQNVKITDFKLKGDTYQQTYSGKNLFDKSTIIEDKYIDASGNFINDNNNFIGDFILIDNTKSYYISASSGQAKRIAYYDNSKSFISRELISAVGGLLTIPNNAKYVRLSCYNVNLDSLQLEQNTQATTYEPYVGGVPSPNPDYPQEIQSVTGLQNVEVCGKNLFNYNLFETFTTTIQYLTLNLKPNTQYTMSSDIPVTSGVGTNLFFMKDGETASTTNNGVRPDTPRTLTTDNTGIVKIGYRTNSNLSSNPKTDYWYQLEQNNQATTYEPYKGNTYEVNLGKNLFKTPVDVITGAGTGITATYNDDGSITFNGTSTGGVTAFRSRIITSNIHTLSYTSNQTNNNIYIRTRAFSSNIEDFSSIQDSIILTATSNSITSNKSIGCVEIDIANNTTLDNFTIYPQLELGKIATSFSPYFTPIELNKIGDYEDSIKKSTGKNLFDKGNATYTNGSINDSGEETTSTNSLRVNEYIEVKPQTNYICSYNEVGNSYLNVIACYDETKTFITRLTNIKKETFVTPANTKYVRLVFYNSAGITINNLSNIQLEQNNVITDYEPYGKVWYIEKHIDKVVLDGSETWNLASNYTNNSRFVGDNVVLGTTTSLLSNYFVEGSGGTDTTNIDTNGSSGKLMITIPNSIATTSPAFTTWLSNNNVEILYQLATPIYEVITNTELIEQLEEIKNLILFDGENNISISSEVLKGIMSFNYVIDKHFINIENASYKSYPIIEIAGKDNVSVNINNNIFYLNNIDGEYVLDCKNQVITKDGLNASSNMLGNFPILEIGENKISYSGDITKFNIKYKKAYL